MQILARACALAPERRYRSAKALRKALAALALRVGLRTRVWPVLRLALLAAALVALGVLLARAFAPAPTAAPGELLFPGKGSPVEQPVYRVVGENGDFTFVPVLTTEQLEEDRRAAEQVAREASEAIDSAKKAFVPRSRTSFPTSRRPAPPRSPTRKPPPWTPSPTIPPAMAPSPRPPKASPSLPATDPFPSRRPGHRASNVAISRLRRSGAGQHQNPER